MVASIAMLVIISFIPNVYAESEFEQSLFEVFDWINEIISPSIQDPSLDNATQTNYQEALDAGTESGKKGVSLWFGIHEFFVNLIFAGTTSADLPIDKDLIVIVSMLAVGGLMISLILHLIKENSKIAIIIVAILIALGLVGIMIEF